MEGIKDFEYHNGESVELLERLKVRCKYLVITSTKLSLVNVT